MRLAGVLNHLGGHAAALQREVHLLGFFVRHPLVHFAVDEERRRLHAARVGERRLADHAVARRFIPGRAEELGFLRAVDVGGAVVADPVADAGAGDGGGEAIRVLGDQPVGHEPAVGMTGVANALRVDRIPRDDVVHAGDHVFAVLVSPRAPGRPLELLAVAGGAAEVRVEDKVAVSGEVLLLEIEGIASGSVRAAVTEDDERVRPFRSFVRVRVRQPALDLRAVLARPLEAIRLAQCYLGGEIRVRVRQSFLAGAVDVRDVDVAGGLVHAHGVSDLRHRLVVGEGSDSPSAFRNLLHARPEGRAYWCVDAEQVGFAADGGGEVDELAVGTPAAVAGLEIPVGGQVERFRTCPDGAQEQVARAAVIQLLLDHHVGAERPRVREVLAVGREVDVGVVVAVVGQLRELPVEGHGVEIGLAVAQFVAPVRIRREREGLPVGMPDNVARADVEIHERLRLGSRCGARPERSRGFDDDLQRIARRRIRRRERRAVALEILPVEGDALEAFLVALLEFARVFRLWLRGRLLA